MPRSAIATGDVDYALRVEEIPEVLLRYAAHLRQHGAGGSLEKVEKDYLDNILALILARQGYDFRCYKRGTLSRRIQRRMGLSHMERLSDYHQLLRGDAEEVRALSKDLLIGVTGFFREPEAWETLARTVLQELVQRRGPGDTVRVWVPGCATGEEAYGLAMLLLEAGEALGKGVSPVIFATDVDKDALEAARNGSYPEGIAADLSTERLQRFFHHNGDKYEVKKFLRETVIFAPQNLISDPPFSNLDLISCRNLLIYIESQQQDRLIGLFHFALREGGALILGGSETIGQNQDLFHSLSKKWRIYRRAEGGRARALEFPRSGDRSRPLYAPQPELRHRREPGFAQLTQRFLLERFAPAAVLIDARFQVLYYYGAVRDYIGPSTGEPTDDLLSLAGEGLRSKLRAALHQATANHEPAAAGGANIRRGEGWHSVGVSVYPLRDTPEQQGLLLVTFEDEPQSDRTPGPLPPADTDEHAVFRQLEEELKGTREELRSTIEQMETSNEELKASNEEVMSMNEELQSTNEELETSKEELQSLNEELTTLNSQLEDKVHELEGTNNDLSNLLISTDIATIFVDRTFRIRRYTPAATQLMRLIPGDLGRALTDIAWRFRDEQLLEEAAQVLAGAESAAVGITLGDRRCFLRRLLPYRTEGGEVEGVVITFTDITERRRMELAVAQSEAVLRRVTDAIPVLISQVDRAETYHFNNAAYEQWFGLKREELRGRPVREVLGEEAYALVRPHLQQALAGDPVDFEAELPYRLGGSRFVQVNYVPDRDESGQVQGLFALIHDLSERRRAEQALREREAEFRALFTVSGTGAAEAEIPGGRFVRVNPKYCEITGYSEAELLEMTSSDLTHPDDRETDQALIAVVFRGEETQWEVEKRYLRKDGEIVWVWVTGALIRDAQGRPWRTAAVIQDITARKALERELHEQAAWLQAADRQKNEFLALLGHELRNPLMPIVNALELLELRGTDPETLRWAVDMLRRQTRHLVRLVDDLLDVARISKGVIRMERGPVVLQQVLSETLDMLGPELRAHGHRLQVEQPEGPLTMEGDAVRLTQVLSNLIGNSIKYTPDGGQIRVGLHRAGESAELTVEDNGAGMAPETLARVFEAFSIGSPTGRAVKGLGLGLYLVQRLVELHGGEVSATSSGLGQGSRVVVRLPLTGSASIPQVASPAVQDCPLPSAAAAGRRVLVVDDNRDIADSLDALLTSFGYRVHCAYSGTQALEAAASFSPQVVLLDIGLPDMDGYQVAARLRQTAAGEALSIIAISGHADRNRQPDQAHLFQHWLLKPASLTDLRAVMEAGQPGSGTGGGIARRGAAAGASRPAGGNGG
jgi:two-component system, chemotaxis family, CheB/CheR fusion protein